MNEWWTSSGIEPGACSLPWNSSNRKLIEDSVLTKHHNRQKNRPNRRGFGQNARQNLNQVASGLSVSNQPSNPKNAVPVPNGPEQIWSRPYLCLAIQVCWETSENFAPIRRVGFTVNLLPDSSDGLHDSRRTDDH